MSEYDRSDTASAISCVVCATFTRRSQALSIEPLLKCKAAELLNRKTREQFDVRAGVDMIRLWPAWIHADPALVARVHALGKPVWTTAGTLPREELETLIRMGVNGILTDVPEVLAPLLADLRAARR